MAREARNTLVGFWRTFKLTWIQFIYLTSKNSIIVNILCVKCQVTLARGEMKGKNCHKFLLRVFGLLTPPTHSLVDLAMGCHWEKYEKVSSAAQEEGGWINSQGESHLMKYEFDWCNDSTIPRCNFGSVTTCDDAFIWKLVVGSLPNMLSQEIPFCNKNWMKDSL